MKCPSNKGTFVYEPVASEEKEQQGIHYFKGYAFGSEAFSNGYGKLQVNLKYFKNIPAIRGMQQISRPGNRTYMNTKRILKYSSEQN